MKLIEGISQKGAFLQNPADGSLLIGFGGEFDFVTHFESNDVGTFYLKDFFQKKYLRYRPHTLLKLYPLEQKELLNSLPDSDAEFISKGSEDKTYSEDFQELMNSFSEKLKKVVMISRESFVPSEEVSLPLHFLKKALTFGTGIPYGLWSSDFGIIGSTPEELFTLRGDEISTYALAGTSKKGMNQELLQSKKDRHEHELVIRDISEKLLPYTNCISPQETHIVEFKSLIHLRTDIKAKMKADVDLAKLVEDLSPTAALGGYPKSESLQFLQSTRYFKNHPERSFGSAMGVITAEEARFVVMIRNVQWKNDQVFIECGGGVVPDSELGKELEEISWKRQVVKDHYL